MTDLDQPLLSPEQYDDEFGEVFEMMRENGADEYAEEMLDAIGDVWELHKPADHTYVRYSVYPVSEEVVVKICSTCRDSRIDPGDATVPWPCETARALMNGIGVLYP